MLNEAIPADFSQLLFPKILQQHTLPIKYHVNKGTNILLPQKLILVDKPKPLYKSLASYSPIMMDDKTSKPFAALKVLTFEGLILSTALCQLFK